MQPDIVLIEVDMPGDDGIDTARRLKSEFPDVTVVMLTVHDAIDKLLDTIEAGVSNTHTCGIGASLELTRSHHVSRYHGPGGAVGDGGARIG